MVKRRRWTREETIIALGLYHELKFGDMHARNPRVIELARLLDRTPGSVAMKLCNFAALDANIKQKGLENVSAMDLDIWDEYSDDRMKLLSTIVDILKKFMVEGVGEES